MLPRSPFRPGWPLPLLALAAGCGGGDPGGDGDGGGGARFGSPPVVEAWTLTESPLVQIGVREGEEPYQLHRAQGSVLLEDGRVVVLNGGSQELRYYDREGRYLGAVGRQGEGPGEFQWPEGLRRSADGGLQVWDGGLMRLSRFDVEGGFRESVRLQATGAELFPGDDWILGPNWVVSPVAPGARTPIRQAVEALPPPDSVGTLRIVRVTPQGRLWVPRSRPPADTPITWDVYDLSGRAVARVVTPPRFQPHEIGEAHVTGLFLDEMDVNVVRVYGLVKPPRSPPGPGLNTRVGEGSAGGAVPRPAPPEEVLAEVRSLLKNMASLQEIHYSQHYTYTPDPEALFATARVRVPDGIAVEILFAGSEGWATRVSHETSGAACVMAYGFYVPMGWQPGAVICL